MGNFYYLMGDHYLCSLRKEAIVQDLLENFNFETINFSSEDANSFAKQIGENYLFGQKGSLYVHNGKIPDPSKSIHFVENLIKNKSKHLIILDENIDKKSIFYKTFPGHMEIYESVIQNNGFPDKKKISLGINYIRKFVKNIDDPVIQYIFEKNNYNFGITINEIKKCLIYFGKYISSVDQIINILSDEEVLLVGNLVELLNKKRTKEFILKTNVAMSLSDLDGFFNKFFGSLNENFGFMMICRNAIDLKILEMDEISEYISENYVKKGQKIDKISAEKRYYFFKEYVHNFTSEKIGRILSGIDKSIFLKTVKNYPERYLINKFLYDISQIV